MSPASGTVLVLAAAASSPALYNGLVTGTLPIDQMLTRYLISVVAVWLGLSLLAMLVGDARPRVVEIRREPDPADQA